MLSGGDGVGEVGLEIFKVEGHALQSALNGYDRALHSVGCLFFVGKISLIRTLWFENAPTPLLEAVDCAVSCLRGFSLVGAIVEVEGRGRMSGCREVMWKFPVERRLLASEREAGW